MSTRPVRLALAVIAMAAPLAVVLVLIQRDSLSLDAFRGILYVTAGGVSGYFWGRYAGWAEARMERDA